MSVLLVDSLQFLQIPYILKCISTRNIDSHTHLKICSLEKVSSSLLKSFPVVHIFPQCIFKSTFKTKFSKVFSKVFSKPSLWCLTCKSVFKIFYLVSNTHLWHRREIHVYHSHLSRRTVTYVCTSPLMKYVGMFVEMLKTDFRLVLFGTRLQ